MKIGLYPFASNHSITSNTKKIIKGIKKASEEHVDLVVFHECALCGYPPTETSFESINPKEIHHALLQIANQAKTYKIYVAVGTILYDEEKAYNSIAVFNDQGQNIGSYDKKALWGWDSNHYLPGSKDGIFAIKELNVGFRICFDVRFPELFRELFKKVDLCVVSFSDTSDQINLERYNIIKSHLITRAVENVMPILAVNSLSKHQTAPNIIIGRSGQILFESEPQIEDLIIYEHHHQPLSFGQQGIVENSIKLIKK